MFMTVNQRVLGSSHVKCIKANQNTKNIFILSGQSLLVASNLNYSNEYAGFYLEGNILKQDNIPFYPIGCNYNIKFHTRPK